MDCTIYVGKKGADLRLCFCMSCDTAQLILQMHMHSHQVELDHSLVYVVLNGLA